MSSLIKYFMMLFLGLLGLALILRTCASGVDPVVPDTYVPPTLQVVVTINEDQDASNSQVGSSTITLQFLTNEIQGQNNFVTFGPESVICNGVKLVLNNYGSNVTSYSIHMTIPNPPEYTCTYYYPVNGETKSAHIFTQPVLSQLNPILQKPIPNDSNISISYQPDQNPPNCQVQVTANSPNGNATGNSVAEDGNIYPGSKGGTLNAGSLSGLGNILMTRTCMPPDNNYDHQNANDDGCQCNGSALGFDKLSLTYISIASYEVSWFQSGPPTITTS